MREISAYRIFRGRHEERDICGDIHVDGGE
jgi:hypothetical protein